VGGTCGVFKTSIRPNIASAHPTVNHRTRHAAHRVVIISMISMNIKIIFFLKGVNNEIPGAYSMVSKGKL
jgi:hypothetical protein